jgi:hypothetical protein
MQKVIRNKKTKKEVAMSQAIARVSTSVAPTAQTIDYIAESFGRYDFIRAMRLCSAEVPVMEMLQIYDRLDDKQKKTVSLDMLCQQVEMAPDKLVATVCQELTKINGQTMRMIMSTATPEVLRAGIKVASTPEGIEDRKMVYQMSGLMPFDRGNEININQSFAGIKGVPRFEDAADADQSIIGEVVKE